MVVAFWPTLRKVSSLPTFFETVDFSQNWENYCNQIYFYRKRTYSWSLITIRYFGRTLSKRILMSTKIIKSLAFKNLTKCRLLSQVSIILKSEACSTIRNVSQTNCKSKYRNIIFNMSANRFLKSFCYKK